MGLKTFHLVFVFCAVLLALALGTWATNDYRRSGDSSSLGLAVAGFALGAALLVYAPWFLRKLRGVGYL